MAVFLPRDEKGRLVAPLLDTAELEDQAPAQQPAEPILQTAPVGSPPPPPPRRRGDTPTPFHQLTPASGATAAATRNDWSDWRQWAPGAIALLAVFAVIYGLISRPLTPAIEMQPAALPTASVASPTEPLATVAPTTTPLPALARAVVAYDAPYGQAVGALEPGRAYALLQEYDGWRQLDAAGSGAVWVRGWEMDGIVPATVTPLPTAPPAPAAPPRPAQVAPVGPPVTCVPVFDETADRVYLGQACGATSQERQARALELLQAATP